MSISHHSERATKPEDLPRFFVERANEGDVDGLLDLYEPDAVLARQDLEPPIGLAAIRGFYTALLSELPKFVLGQLQPVLHFGDLALTSTRLTNGSVTAEIARKQTDGTGRWIIDQPAISRTLK